jgi:hypothetical protein
MLAWISVPAAHSTASSAGGDAFSGEAGETVDTAPSFAFTVEHRLGRIDPRMNRRNFLGLSAATVALSATALTSCNRAPHTAPTSPAEDARNALPTGSRKKGLGQSAKTPAWSKRLTDLRCKWFYSWNSVIPEGVPPGVAFVPMIYRYGGNAEAIHEAAAAAKNAGITELLGFNEPDVAKQGNMTLEETLDAWPLLMETGLRLGSPGCVHPDKEWMIQFMDGVKKRGLRVDFVAVHSYGGPNAAALVKRLEKVHQMFNLPIWITEFGAGDWEAKSVEENRHKPDAVLRFMEQVLPMLDRLDFVERYAWFPAKPTSIPLGTSALHNADGSLTRLGECYRDA